MFLGKSPVKRRKNSGQPPKRSATRQAVAGEATCRALWGAIDEPYAFVDASYTLRVVSAGAQAIWGPRCRVGSTLSSLGCVDVKRLDEAWDAKEWWQGTVPWRLSDAQTRAWTLRARPCAPGRHRGLLIRFLHPEPETACKTGHLEEFSQEPFSAFMRHLPGVAYIKNLEGQYVFVSESFERHFGHPPEFYLGRADREVWPEDVVDELRANDRLVIETRTVVQTTDKVPQADGVHYWLTTKFPILDATGAVCLVGGVAVDVTEERRAVEHLRELQRVTPQRERLADVGAITAQILHDLANPLAGLSMQVQLLIRRASRDPSQPVGNLWPAARQILAEAQRIDALLREFKDFTREQRLELQLLDLKPFLAECVTQWRPLTRARDVALHAELEDRLPVVRADGDKLRRVLDNLVRNSLEAIDRGPGRILLRSHIPETERVRISVIDDGPGVPPSVDPFRLFETTKPYGTGLGLPIAQQIVRAHGGQIWFERLDPRGTAFHVDLLRGGPLFSTVPGSSLG